MSDKSDIPPKDQRSWLNFGLSLAKLISRVKQRKPKKRTSQSVGEPVIRTDRVMAHRR